jgi:GNAT superfamily N-acetyltransferase
VSARAPLPLVSHALTRRIEAAAAAYMLGWLESSRTRPGNPNGIELVRFGRSIAASATAAADVDFMNRVYGLTPADVGQVAAVVEHYRVRGVQPWFETAPAEGAEELVAALWRAGARQTATLAAFYGRPEGEPTPPLPAGAAIVEIGADDHDGRRRFGRTLAAGHGVPEEHLVDAEHGIAAWPRDAGWRLYLAQIDGRPAAAAVLTTVDGLAYLANASTLPSARGRGLQAALIARRIADARSAGCDVVASLAAFEGASARNLQRAGLRLAFLVTEWRGPAPADRT